MTRSSRSIVFAATAAATIAAGALGVAFASSDTASSVGDTASSVVDPTVAQRLDRGFSHLFNVADLKVVSDTGGWTVYSGPGLKAGESCLAIVASATVAAGGYTGAGCRPPDIPLSTQFLEVDVEGTKGGRVGIVLTAGQAVADASGTNALAISRNGQFDYMSEQVVATSFATQKPGAAIRIGDGLNAREFSLSVPNP